MNDTLVGPTALLPAGFAERFAEVNGVRLRFLIGGRGSPVALLHDTPGNLLVSGKTAQARHIGAHANVAVEWQANRHLSFEAHYLHFFPGRFLKEVGLDRQVNFVGVWATFKF